MIRLLTLCCVCLLVPRVGAAATLVSWESQGEILFSQFLGLNSSFVPPSGTPYQLTMSFDPSAATPTFAAPAGSNCVTVAATGSITIGSTTFGLTGKGFTHAQLPGTNCSPGWHETQFLFGLVDNPASPWPVLNNEAFMELWYTDEVVRDAFPAAPTTLFGAGFQIRNDVGNFRIRGRGDLEALGAAQPAPVPEPGTMVLVGIGLAAAIRRGRAARRG